MRIQNKTQWEKYFVDACQQGHLEKVRHLSQKKYLDLGWADIHWDDDKGFLMACGNGHLEIVKYLLTSKELIEAGHAWVNLHENLHENNEYGFRWACYYGYWDVIRWLVMDYGIKKTPLIEEMIKNHPQAQEYFLVREEMETLNETISQSIRSESSCVYKGKLKKL